MPRLVRSAAPRQAAKDARRQTSRAEDGGSTSARARSRSATSGASSTSPSASRPPRRGTWKGDDEGALGVFALCLLFGFRGALYGDAAQLARIRRACRGLFDRVAGAQDAACSAAGASELLVWGERAAYVALPLLVCILFALYCGGVLANAPFHGKF